MRKSSKERAQKILDNYLETNNHRKTPERYAVLEAVYSMKGHFSLEALRERLEVKHFPVSRATLYNTLKIFINLRLIVCHRLADGTTYEAIEDKENHIHQICTICGAGSSQNRTCHRGYQISSVHPRSILTLYLWCLQ